MNDLDTIDFLMVIEDVFQITGRGTVVTGGVAKGIVSIGDTLCLMDASMNVVSDNIGVKSLEVGFSRTRPTSADEGMNVALILGKIDIVIKEGYILRGL